ncbi:caspase family protein [Streptomyces sp. ID05-04B]|uniref:caspase family protein n=1 Tax=Streptomyces sp. ID05-04B TaxID=3028661 RepID=UPI0029C9D7A3|nr:caspase family protein [Streptomyces sp. ID05-04B]
MDLALVDDQGEPWPFEEEEIEFTCVLDGARHFRVEAVQDASVVMHRFGGTYAPAQFVVVARQAPGRHALRLTPVTSHGVVIGSVEVPVEVRATSDGQDGEDQLRTLDLARPTSSGAPVASSSSRKALCIVVGRYEDSGRLNDLPGAYEAGQRVADGLTALGYACTHLVDPHGREIVEETTRFLTGEDTLRIVYYTGHGLYRHGSSDLFLAGTDTNPEDPVMTAICFPIWQSNAATFGPGDPILYLLDTCHSGYATLMPERDVRRPHYVVASCRASERSYNNLFSNSLADVLDRAATGRLTQGRPGTAVPLSTLVEGIDHRMRELAPDMDQTVTSSLTVPRPTDPAFIPVVAPVDTAEHLPRTPSLRVLGLHGFSRENRGYEDWGPAIRDGIHLVDPSADVSAVDLSFAHFGDLLRPPYALGGSAPDDENGRGDDPEATPEESEVLAEWLAAVDAGRPRRRLNPYTAVRQVVSRLTGSRAMERVLFASLRELARYFQSEPREAVTARVHQAVTVGRPRVILAYSLGSIVAYEALWREPYPQAEVLVTMGSPLGLRTVVDRLAPHGHGCPPGVSRWYDVAGAADVVAVPRDGVTKNFSGVMHMEIDTGTASAHMARSYLTSPAVATILADLLRSL